MTSEQLKELQNRVLTAELEQAKIKSRQSVLDRIELIDEDAPVSIPDCGAIQKFQSVPFSAVKGAIISYLLVELDQAQQRLAAM